MSVSSPTPTIQSLRDCSSLSDLARLLELEPKELSFILYKTIDSQKYSEFTMSKKDGSLRLISAPIPKLKYLQNKTLKLFHAVAGERDTLRGTRKGFAHGARKGSSIILNAEEHSRKRFVINFDLSDFFPSIHIGRLIGFLTKDKYLLIDKKVATVIAQIVTNDRRLPQGAPTSSIFANFVSEILDRRILQLCKESGAKYSRYIDDITISTTMKELPERIGRVEDEIFHLSDEIIALVEKCGFKINPTKTRMATSRQRQSVTGLIVNKHPNLSNSYARQTRAMCRELLWSRQPFRTEFWGQAEMPISPQQIEGRLSFENLVRSRHLKRGITVKLDKPTKFEKLHRDFLLHKYLIRGRGPAFICEGESDRIYIDVMIKRLRSESSVYFLNDHEGRKRQYEIPGNSETFHELTSLGGGTSNMSHGLLQISRFLKKYKNPEPRWPTIVLVDSDKAGFSFAEAAGSWFDAKFDRKSCSDVFPIRLGLYIVFVPVPTGRGSAVIETLIPEELKKIELGGKRLSLDNKYDTEKYFGKTILAKNIRDDKSLDLNFFEPLMERIDSAVALFESDLILSG